MTVEPEIRARTAATPPVLAEGDISLLGLVVPLMRRWKLIVTTAVGSGILTTIVLLITKPVYVAETSFTPEAPSPASGLAGLVGLAGVAGLIGSSGASPMSGISQDFLAQVVHSREILRATLLTTFPDPAARQPRALLDILRVRGDSMEERLQKGTQYLDRKLQTDIDRRTGIITLRVSMPSSPLAAQVGNRVVELLNQFNLERRQSQSRAQRRFAGERLTVAERELGDAEAAQLNFLTRNRSYAESPLLAFEAARLERQVRLKTEVFTTLRKNYEEARIAEVRDTPVLTVVDSAVAPVRRASPRRALGTTVAVALGLLLGILVAYSAEYLPRSRARRLDEIAGMAEGWDDLDKR